jgi:hypothetical protein
VLADVNTLRSTAKIGILNAQLRRRVSVVLLLVTSASVKIPLESRLYVPPLCMRRPEYLERPDNQTPFQRCARGQLKCDGKREETTFLRSEKRTSPFKSAGDVSSVDYWQPRCAHRGSNAGYTMFRGSVKGTGYPPHSPVSPSLPLQCVTVCHHISTGVYP